MPLVLITGDDDTAIKAKAAAVVAECVAQSGDALSLEVIDYKSVRLGKAGSASSTSESAKPHQIVSELVKAIGVPSFFGTKRTLWLKHFAGFKHSSDEDGEESSGTGKGKKDSPLQKAFSDVVDMINAGCLDDTTLVIDAAEMDRRSSFYKFCEKKGVVHLCQKLNTMDKNYGRSLREKIAEICAAEGTRIDPAAIDFIAETAGGDTGRLTMEVRKLACHADLARGITLADCREVGARTPEAAAWAFADALASMSLDSALGSLDVLLESKRAESSSSSRPELPILYGAISKFKDLIKMGAAASRLSIKGRCSYQTFQAKIASAPEELKTELEDNPIVSWHPYRAYKVYEQFAAFPQERMARCLTFLLEANRELVSSASSPRLVLENLAVAICARGK